LIDHCFTKEEALHCFLGLSSASFRVFWSPGSSYVSS